MATQSIRREMLLSKCKTCRQFVDFSAPIVKSLIVLSKTKYFVSKLRTKEKKKNSSHFCFGFSKQVAEFIAQELQEIFS